MYRWFILRIKPTSAYEYLHMHLLVFEHLLPYSSSQPLLPLCFMKGAENLNIPKIFPFQEYHWPIICVPNLFSPFFSISLQKNYSHTAPELWICVWVKHPVLDWRRSYPHMLCSPYKEFLLIKLQKLCLHALNFPSPLYLLPCHSISPYFKHTQIQIKHMFLFWHLPSW